jgi:trimethylamine:corrinoid methyltransferase-like protein
MEKLVLDNEVCGLARRLARGFAANPGDVDVIREVVLSRRGNFMAHRHTLANLRKEIHVPRVWDVEPTTRRDLLNWAHEEVERLLKERKRRCSRATGWKLSTRLAAGFGVGRDSGLHLQSSARRHLFLP